MAFQILGSVLAFAIGGFMEILHDFDACRLRPFEMRVHIVDEYGQALTPAPGLGGAGAPRPRAIEHDPGVAEMHLCAIHPHPGLAIAVVLAETERFCQPN